MIDHRDVRAALSLDQVAALRAIAMRFGAGNETRQARALGACAKRAIRDADVLLAYHDCLLFMLAYPKNAELLASARAELLRVAELAQHLTRPGSAKMRTRLEGHGIAWSEGTHNFGWDIARWLATRFPGNAEVDSFGEGVLSPQQALAAALLPMEFDIADPEALDADAFLEDASAGHKPSRLAWLVAGLQRTPCPDVLREHVFDALGTFIVLRPQATPLSRTFARGLPHRPFFHRRPLVRQVDVARTVAQPLAIHRPLSRTEREAVLDAGRATLAAMGRETDAIARADADGVAWHHVGRGVAIALYTMRPERRSPLDSHVGMMLFKNSLPIGYGGGWPFFDACRIGVNIFEPYRGGESAFLFCQALRVFGQRFGVTRFVAEPSQFGGSGIEGLKSGAFWFYYRLGFRPMAERAAELARAEFARQQTTPGYRTPLPTLKRFTRSDIELRLAPADASTARNGSGPEPSYLSAAVSAWIARRFNGDRLRAEAFAARSVARALDVEPARWRGPSRAALAALAPLLTQIRDLRRWPRRDKRALVAIIHAKGGDEFAFFALLRGHTRLHGALEKISRRPA